MFGYLYQRLYPLRHPFKQFQKFMNIEEEWKDFKGILRPHKYKILVLGSIVGFPLYKNIFRYKFLEAVQNELQRDSPVDQIVKDYAKQSVQDLLRDQAVQKESLQFVDRLAKHQTLQESIVLLLRESIKHPTFIDDSKLFSKDLALQLLKDKEIEYHVQQLLLNMANDVEVKHELKETLKWIVDQEDSKDVMVELLKKTSQDQIFRDALAGAMTYAFNDVLMRKETTEKLRIFAYYLVETETKHNNVKGLIDLVIDKATKKKQNKDDDFEKILQGISNQTKQ